MRKYIVSLLLCGSILTACGTEKIEPKQTLGSMEKEKQAAVVQVKQPEAKPEPPAAAAPAEAQGEAAPLTWEGFFDGTDQTKPSQHFLQLNNKKVTLEGYMGEMVSMNKGWFLLIQAPGAECPFCSTDQTFWNRIMIVFVKEPGHLRYIPGKVRVTGTLDVGEKKDQSGYTTMFRLYHAEFASAQ